MQHDSQANVKVETFTSILQNQKHRRSKTHNGRELDREPKLNQ
jgi:hypothetical protein